MKVTRRKTYLSYRAKDRICEYCLCFPIVEVHRSCVKEPLCNPPCSRMAEASGEEPKFLIFGKTGWIGGLVGEELEKQVRSSG